MHRCSIKPVDHEVSKWDMIHSGSLSEARQRSYHTFQFDAIHDNLNSFIRNSYNIQLQLCLLYIRSTEWQGSELPQLG